METMPGPRAEWQIPDRNTPWIRTINTVDPLTGVPTEWRQDLSLFSKRRIDTLPKTGFRRIITYTKPSLKFPIRPSARPFSDRIEYCIEETVGSICYRASLEDPVDLEPEFRLGIDDSQENCWYQAFYRPKTLAEVNFFQSSIIGTSELKVKDRLPVKESLNGLLDLVKVHGEVAFVPDARFSNHPQGEIFEDARNVSLNDLNEKTISWTPEEKREVADRVAGLLKQLLQELLPNEKSDGHEMSIMFKWLYLEIMRTLPRDFETLVEKAQKVAFKEEFTFAVSNSLLLYENSLADFTDYVVELTFGSLMDPVDVKFTNLMDGPLYATKLQDDEMQSFDIYNFSVSRGERVMVVFQRLVRPHHRFVLTIPKVVNIDDFRKIASTADSIGWEEAKEVAWAKYIKV